MLSCQRLLWQRTVQVLSDAQRGEGGGEEEPGRQEAGSAVVGEGQPWALAPVVLKPVCPPQALPLAQFS